MRNFFQYRAGDRQRGQAMVEFVVAATFFLVPLFLAIVVMAKFSDVQHTTNMAGRYAAWERTVWYDDSGTTFNTHNGSNQKSAVEIGHEVGVRVINDGSLTTSVIKNTDRAATTFANGIHPMWHDNAGVAYLSSYDQQSSTVTREAPKLDMAGLALGTIGSISVPGVIGSLVPPVPSDTLAVATVSFGRVARDSQAYQRLWPKATVWVDDWAGVDFTSTGAILSNTWGANGSGATTAMVKESVPMSKGLATFAGTVTMTAMTAWNLFGAPDAEFGKVAPDVVPGDRLR